MHCDHQGAEIYTRQNYEHKMTFFPTSTPRRFTHYNCFALIRIHIV